MLIYLGADHRGFNLKEYLKGVLKNQAYEVFDFGASIHELDDDYPDFASAVAKKVRMDPEQSRGIIICGSGVGVDVVANKFPEVRSVLASSPDQVSAARREDNVNILSLGADFMSQADAEKIMKVFLATPFGTEPRYQRRINKISTIENSLKDK